MLWLKGNKRMHQLHPSRTSEADGECAYSEAALSDDVTMRCGKIDQVVSVYSSFVPVLVWILPNWIED